VAAHAASDPTRPLAALADQLRDADAHDGVGLLAGGDAATDVRAVFSWSYRALGAEAARLFRLVGLHPGPDLATTAAASLTGLPVARVRPLLAELVRAHLLAEHAPGRYAAHDLLRAYASELAHAHDGDLECRAATHRLLDHYLHTADRAARLLYRYDEAVALTAPQPGAAADDLTGPDQAMAWLAAEEPVLLAAVNRSAHAGFHRHTCHLARALFVHLHRRGHWHDRAATQRAALDAARRLGDRAEQARAHRNLAAATADLGRYDDAHRHLRRALDLCRDLGDLTGQAWAHYHRNLVYGLQGRQAEALEEAQRALQLFRDTGDRVGQAVALSDVGWYHGRLGDHRQAVALCRQALALHRQLDNRAYQAHTWSCLGDTHLHLGDHPQATACYHQALELFQELGDRYAEASTLAHLGACHHAAGDPVAARGSWQQARELLDTLDPSAADQVRTQLRQLSQPAAEAFLAGDRGAGRA
jgi:tetratricopeptide (TPR) repeat protein